MLLTGYTKDVFRPECNPNFTSVHCIAHLKEDVGAALPYLNTVLGGTQFLEDPPELMFHHQGRIIKVGAREIAINALEDEQEAERILQWLKDEINQAWANRTAITPCYTGKSRPKVIEILQLLPRTNCRQCGQPTCMAFAAQMADGGRSVEQCPDLVEADRTALAAYLAGFDLDW
jgi:ArsR family metal-binding transcriptional regulator